MKKILATLSILALGTTSFDACAAQQNKSFREKMSGWEFGVGVPLVTPLTGYNMFVGYVNKNATSFWGKRFGLRFDFTIPSPLRLNATLNDNNIDGYDIDLNMKALWMNIKRPGFETAEYIKDDQDNPIHLDPNSVKAAFELKNKSMGLLVDFYPFGNTWFLGGIRLTGGYYIGDLDISANVKTSKNIDYMYSVGNVGDNLRAQIAAGSRIGVKYHWNYSGPYAGLGFDLGIWRGFKFYMDAGVVFSQAPKFKESNIDDKHFVLKGRYEINGIDYSNNTNMVTIMNGAAEKPQADKIVSDTIGQTAKDFLTSSYGQDPMYNSVVTRIQSDYGVSIADVNIADLANDVKGYLNGTSNPQWIENLVAVTNPDPNDPKLEETIKDIKDNWDTIAVATNTNVQEDIDKVWDDYQDAKKDTIDDINKVLKDIGIVPMVKIGFMYRF